MNRKNDRVLDMFLSVCVSALIMAVVTVISGVVFLLVKTLSAGSFAFLGVILFFLGLSVYVYSVLRS